MFKLVDLKDNSLQNKNNNRSNLQSRDTSFHSTISNKRGFIRFGGMQGDNDMRTKKMGNSRSIESEGKRERIMHSAFYMHKFHNEMEQNNNSNNNNNNNNPNGDGANIYRSVKK